MTFGFWDQGTQPYSWWSWRTDRACRANMSNLMQLTYKSWKSCWIETVETVEPVADSVALRHSPAPGSDSSRPRTALSSPFSEPGSAPRTQRLSPKASKSKRCGKESMTLTVPKAHQSACMSLSNCHYRIHQDPLSISQYDIIRCWRPTRIDTQNFRVTKSLCCKMLQNVAKCCI